GSRSPPTLGATAVMLAHEPTIASPTSQRRRAYSSTPTAYQSAAGPTSCPTTHRPPSPGWRSLTGTRPRALILSPVIGPCAHFQPSRNERHVSILLDSSTSLRL